MVVWIEWWWVGPALPAPQPHSSSYPLLHNMTLINPTSTLIPKLVVQFFKVFFVFGDLGWLSLARATIVLSHVSASPCWV